MLLVLIFVFSRIFQLPEDDVSDWEEGEATDEALEVPRRVPFPEFGGDIVHKGTYYCDFSVEFVIFP